jgi:hypothetical protein
MVISHIDPNGYVAYLPKFSFNSVNHSQDFGASLPMRVTSATSGFGGLAVSMPASGTQVRGFKPGRKPSDFSGVKILSMQ